MNLKAAFLVTSAASGFLLVAACGGGDAGPPQTGNSNSTSQPQTVSAGGCLTALNNASGSTASTGASAQYVAVDLHSSGYTYTQGSGIANGQQVGSSSGDTENPGVNHALLWRGTASSVVDLHPNGFTSSWALATNGTIQVGGGAPSGKIAHALKWSGSADSVVDLDPDSPLFSEARAVVGDQIVGYAHGHAVMWTSAGVVDLNPSGFEYSDAFATDGAQQVGSGLPSGGNRHAMLWSGTAQSAVDLNPAGCLYSIASGVGGEQVGTVWPGNTSTATHAVLWKGSAESVIDLHPSGFAESRALSVAAGRQVGYGAVIGGYRALLWNGTADSVVDLHQFLPPNFFSSQASGIDASGNVVGVAHTWQGCPPFCPHPIAHAILWVRQ